MCNKYGISLTNGHRAENDVIACYELLKGLHAEKSVEDDLNKLGFLKKYGAPEWYPTHANVEYIELKYA
jgi:DNA polymerase-3 subunit epsilon